MKILRIIIFLVFLIWISGAVILSIQYEFDRKNECIRSEGWIKGLVWCETDPHTKSGIASSHFSRLVQGMGWPIRLLNTKAARGLSYIDSLFEVCDLKDSDQADRCVNNQLSKDYDSVLYKLGCQVDNDLARMIVNHKENGIKLDDAIVLLKPVWNKTYDQLSKVGINRHNIAREQYLTLSTNYINLIYLSEKPFKEKELASLYESCIAYAQLAERLPSLTQ